jgi:hypothetical protein
MDDEHRYTFAEIKQKFEEWYQAVDASTLAEPTKRTYKDHPRRMLDWWEGHYQLP